MAGKIVVLRFSYLEVDTRERFCKAIEQVCIVCVTGQAKSESCQSIRMLTHVPGLERLWCCDSLTLKWRLESGLCKSIEQVCIVCVIGQAQSESCQSIWMLTHVPGLGRLRY